MAGTKEGGLKTVATIKDRFGEGYYKKIGAIGGAHGKGTNYRGGFADDRVGNDGLTGRERASEYGAIGGRISRRTKKQV